MSIYFGTNVSKSDKKIHIQFSTPKCANTPQLYTIDTLLQLLNKH